MYTVSTEIEVYRLGIHGAAHFKYLLQMHHSRGKSFGGTDGQLSSNSISHGGDSGLGG
jgi:hypothetical protein